MSKPDAVIEQENKVLEFFQEVERQIVIPLHFGTQDIEKIKEFFSMWGPYDNIKKDLVEVIENNTYSQIEVEELSDKIDELNNKKSEVEDDLQKIIQDLHNFKWGITEGEERDKFSELLDDLYDIADEERVSSKKKKAVKSKKK